MVRTAKHVANRSCESPFCVGMAVAAAALAMGVVIYSSTAILLLLK